MRVLWTLSAEQDRADIVGFIAQDNPLAAIRMDELFGAAVDRPGELLAYLTKNCCHGERRPAQVGPACAC